MFPSEYRGVAFAVALFVVVQLGALALVPEFVEGGYQPVEDPQDPTNSLIYIAAILVMTGLMLAAFKYDFDWAIRLLIIGVSAWLSWYVFAAIVPPAVAVVPAALVGIGLLAYPEWYVIDAAGVLMGAGAAGLFGISFGILPALVLLTFLAVYDAISVYGTEHMLSLAEGVMDLRIPVVLVIPLSLSYSLLDDDFAGAADVHEGEEPEADDGKTETDGEAAADGETATEADDPVPAEESTATDADDPERAPERDAFFIGLGDAVIPAVLVASAATFSPAPALDVPFIGLNLPALFGMIGTVAGLLVLLRWVMKGRAHAGLPLLCGGVILGYLIGSLLAGVPMLEALGVARFV